MALKRGAGRACGAGSAYPCQRKSRAAGRTGTTVQVAGVVRLAGGDEQGKRVLLASGPLLSNDEHFDASEGCPYSLPVPRATTGGSCGMGRYRNCQDLRSQIPSICGETVDHAFPVPGRPIPNAGAWRTMCEDPNRPHLVFGMT